MFRLWLAVLCGLLPLSQRAEGMPRLGAPVAEFHAGYGAPSFQEHLGRTSNAHWRPLRTSDAALLAARAYALEVSAFDGRVCWITVRCRRSLSDAEIARLIQGFFQRRYRVADFTAARAGSAERTWRKRRNGDYVDAGPHQDHYVLSVATAAYWRNLDLFDREAAKVRSPTSNH